MTVSLETLLQSAPYLDGLADRHADWFAASRAISPDTALQTVLLGVKRAPNNRECMALAREKKLLLAGGGDNVVRVIPPLIITEDQVRDAIEKLDATCAEARAKVPA